MMIIAILAAVGTPHVVTTFRDADATRLGIVAELIERPAGSDGPTYAQTLVEEEGLTSWNPSEPTATSRPGSPLAYRARTATDGREVLVYYSAAPDGSAKVCRMRGRSMGMSDARYRALRWCAASLGVTLPEKPPAPVAPDRNGT